MGIRKARMLLSPWLWRWYFSHGHSWPYQPMPPVPSHTQSVRSAVLTLLIIHAAACVDLGSCKFPHLLLFFEEGCSANWIMAGFAPLFLWTCTVCLCSFFLLHLCLCCLIHLGSLTLPKLFLLFLWHFSFIWYLSVCQVREKQETRAQREMTCNKGPQAPAKNSLYCP